MVESMQGATHGISRRTFVEAAAAAAGALALAGCSKESTVSEAAPEGPNQPEPAASAIADEMDEDLEAGAEWIPVACWGNCGGRCLNKALVKDGIVLRQKTDDTHEDSPEYFQQRGCLRGRSMSKYILSANRLRHPMKRKGWMPGGGEKSNGQGRGIDEFEEITWDEALDYIAEELLRVRDEYGTRSVFAVGTEITNMLALYGGYITRWGTTSTGTWTYAAAKIGLFPNCNNGWESLNDRFDLQNADTVVMIGLNAAWASAGSPIYHGVQMRDAGVKFIAVDPFYNDGYSVLGAEWIPSRPNCDTALFLGIAYEMLRLDEAEGGVIDWEFLDKYTIGFDADHMPEGEDPTGNFKDYVLGTYDGVPKTAAWASKICGATEEQITHLARELGAGKKVSLLTSWAPSRGLEVDTWPGIYMTVGAMGGHIGKSGECTSISCQYFCFSGGKTLVKQGSDGLPRFPNPNTEDCFVDSSLWTSIVDGRYDWTGNGKTKRNPAVPKEVDIRVIYNATSRNMLASTEGMMKGIEAYRKVDMVVTHVFEMNTSALYSDIILPLSSLWEADGFSWTGGNVEMMIMHSKIMDGWYDAKTDQEIVRLLAPKVGVDPDELFPISPEQQFFNKAAGATMVDEAGESVPLITITAADIEKMGVEGEPQEGKIGLEEYRKAGVYQIKRKAGDSYSYIANKAFIDNPEENPVSSESGKLEIYCRSLADDINGFGWTTIKPIPTYIPVDENYPGTFKDCDLDGEKGEYPYQVFNPKYLRSSHYEFSDNRWLQETWVRPLFMNSQDAAREGLENGDAVKVTSARGSVVRNLRVTDRLIPGTIILPHGGRPEFDPKTGIDMGGSDNVLTAMRPTGQGASPYNSCLAKVELFKKGGVEEDVEKPLPLEYAN